MSSNIKVQRICQHCGKEFTARTTTTLNCSQTCAKAAYKAKLKAANVELKNKETLEIKRKSIEELKVKEYLTVRDVACLLNCSIRSVYNYIDTGSIKAVILSQRVTRVKRSDIDKLFQPQPTIQIEPLQSEPTLIEISECYNLNEVKNKFNISDKALHQLIKRNGITKIKQGRFTYVPKPYIDRLLS